LNFYDVLPSVNAALNAVAAVLLVWGLVLIKSRKIAAHRRVMITAFSVSAIFLVCYVTYHAHAKIVYFKGTGLIRTVYMTILWTHTPLAAAVPVLAIITLNRGLKARFDKHRAIAKWTWPIWMYVNVTGVVVYLMLFHMS
jgi:putative membrane protein